MPAAHPRRHPLLGLRAGVRVADLRPLGDHLLDAIATELEKERLPADAFPHLDPNNIRIAKTASRRTLGYMNEMASELEWHIAHDGGLDRTDINDLNHALRRMLRNRGGSDYLRPIELVHQRLKAAA